MKKIKTGIIGGAGYTGGELIRLLLHHPLSEIVFVHSKSSAGKYIHEVHPDLLDETKLIFTDTVQQGVDVVFLCLGHGDSKKFLQENPLDKKIRIIDLSQDFRLKSEPNHGFIYGLPELNRPAIAAAERIANPGCFATAIELALLPLAHGNLLDEEVQVSAVTGSTGAGQKPTATTHFTWRDSNISVYKAFTHQHLKEIIQSLKQLQPEPKPRLNFLPFRGNFTRGILAACYLNSNISEDWARKIYQEYYQSHPFVHLSPKDLNVKLVVNTNNCFIHIQKQQGKLLIVSVIDNLLKGASGQAVQNMNLMFRLDETSGLKLKPSGF